MNDSASFHLHNLDTSIWTRSCLGARSPACSPLYVSRYNGPRLNPAPTEHAYWEITAVLSGGGELRASTTIPLRPGTVTVIPPGLRHAEHAAALDSIWIGCTGSTLRRFGSDSVLAIRDLPTAAAVEQLWLLTQQAGAIGPELDAGLAGILARLLRLQNTVAPAASEDIIDTAIRTLQDRFSGAVRIADLARHAGCSEGHFARLFRQRTGQSVVQFLTDLRIRQAVYLLRHTGMTVSEIADRVGFSNLFYFSRVFRRRAGVPPSAYRASV